MIGGTKPVEDATAEVKEICDKIKPELEAKTNRKYDTFTAHKMTTQVVAGTNFFVKVHIGNEEYVHIRVFRDLQQALELTSYQENKGKDDELAYF